MFLKRNLPLMAWTQNVTLTKSPKCPVVADPAEGSDPMRHLPFKPRHGGGDGPQGSWIELLLMPYFVEAAPSNETVP